MDFISTGIQEFLRRLRRRNLRRVIQADEQKIARSEAALARAAWSDLVADPDPGLELDSFMRPLRELDRESATTRERIAAIERILSEVSGRRSEALRRAQAEISRIEADRASVRLQEEALRTTPAAPGADAAVAADRPPSEEYHVRLIALDERLQEVRREQRATEGTDDRQLEELRDRLVPLRLSIDQLDEARDEPLRALGRHLSIHENLIPAAAASALARLRQAQQHLASLTGRERVLAVESEEADPQNLRLSIFVFTSFVVITGLALLLIFRAPARRDWLPVDTQAIVSVHLQRLVAADASTPANVWFPLWRATTTTLAAIPALSNPAASVRRTVRALGDARGDSAAEYQLFETMGPAGEVLTALNEKHGFGQRFDSANLGGLPIYERSSDAACAQIGPQALAFGTAASVSAMIRVRLGLAPDLKIDEQFFEKFQRLDRGSAVRVITRRPGDLASTNGEALLDRELTDACQLLGFAVNLGDPITVVLLVRPLASGPGGRLAALFREASPRLLRLRTPAALLEEPRVEIREGELECRLRLSDQAAREFLERVAAVRLTPH